MFCFYRVECGWPFFATAAAAAAIAIAAAAAAAAAAESKSFDGLNVSTSVSSLS